MLSLWSSLALAGSIYVNGVNVDGLRNQTFEDVTVHIDAEGNVRVDAPQYEIEVMEQPATTAAAPQQTAPAPEPVTPDTGLPLGRWWLVTEDNDSQGHTVQVFLNGKLAKTVRSGDPQVIFDIGPFLEDGRNDVRITSSSAGAGGGTFYVYLGSGSNQSGTVQMDTPQVQFGLGPTRQGAYERTYQLLTGQ